MIDSTGYEVRCDESGCDHSEQHENRFRLYDLMQAEGWQRSVKLNGERAIRGGKDYCPGHRKGSSPGSQS
jgi:hypothetical protein